MPKDLLFHWYVVENNGSIILTEVQKIHLACLSYYKDVFDGNINIVLSLDNINNEKLINNSKELFSFFNKNVNFIVKKNCPYLREAKTFKEEFLDKIDQKNQLLFFAHSKGITNHFNTSLTIWLFGMYYFNLSFIDHIENNLNKGKIFSGCFVRRHRWRNVKHKWHFSGSFYWTNINKLKKLDYSRKLEITENSKKSYFVEEFPGNCTPLKNIYVPQNAYVDKIDLYEKGTKAMAYIDKLNHGNVKNNFYNEMNSVLNKKFPTDELHHNIKWNLREKIYLFYKKLN